LLARRRILLGLTAFAALILFLTYPTSLLASIERETLGNRPVYSVEVVERLKQDMRAQPGSVFTDRPYYAFQANALIPPATAVISRKRLNSGQLSDATLVATLEEYRPRYVVLERFASVFGSPVMDTIHEHCQQVFQSGAAVYYLCAEERW
jgi:hypothetical protein